MLSTPTHRLCLVGLGERLLPWRLSAAALAVLLALGPSCGVVTMTTRSASLSLSLPLVLSAPPPPASSSEESESSSALCTELTLSDDPLGCTDDPLLCCKRDAISNGKSRNWSVHRKSLESAGQQTHHQRQLGRLDVVVVLWIAWHRMSAHDAQP